MRTRKGRGEAAGADLGDGRLLIAKGRPFKVAVTACTRKVIGYLTVMVKEQITYTSTGCVTSSAEWFPSPLYAGERG